MTGACEHGAAYLRTRIHRQRGHVYTYTRCDRCSRAKCGACGHGKRLHDDGAECYWVDPATNEYGCDCVRFTTEHPRRGRGDER